MEENKDLKEAYRITINDLEIAIRSCRLFDFKQKKEYRKHPMDTGDR